MLVAITHLVFSEPVTYDERTAGERLHCGFVVLKSRI